MTDSREANDRDAFETVARLASAAVPVVQPEQRAQQVREALAGQRYESASHIAVCDERAFLGIVTIESLLATAADARMGEIADRDAPRLTPGADQELAAWHAVRSQESALSVVDREGRFVGVIPPHRLLEVLGLDPAFGSGPLATVIQDLLSILIYFAIASAVVQ